MFPIIKAHRASPHSIFIEDVINSGILITNHD